MLFEVDIEFWMSEDVEDSYYVEGCGVVDWLVVFDCEEICLFKEELDLRIEV